MPNERLLRCPACGAAVPASGRPAHEQWHQTLADDLRLVIMPPERETVPISEPPEVEDWAL